MDEEGAAPQIERGKEQSDGAFRRGATQDCAHLARPHDAGKGGRIPPLLAGGGGLHPLAETALAVQMLREDRADETEFVTISWWESVEAMPRFAGDDPRRIHHLPRDPEFLLELPENVQVLEVVDEAGPVAPTPG
jgi:hypothetical protein